MTPGWNQLRRSTFLKIAGCAATMAVFGSCTTFHTPISRELFTPGAPTDSSNRTAASDAAPSFQSPVGFDWPVDSARMTRGFLPNKRRPHLGIDLAAPRGTPILAAQAGTVIYTGREFKGYGKMVLIESGNG